MQHDVFIVETGLLKHISFRSHLLLKQPSLKQRTPFRPLLPLGLLISTMSGGYKKKSWTYGSYAAGSGSSSSSNWNQGSSNWNDPQGWQPKEWKNYEGDDTHGWKLPQPVSGTLLAYANASGEVHDVLGGDGGGSRTTEAELPDHKHIHDLKEGWGIDEKELWTDGKGNLFRTKAKNSPVNSNMSLTEVQQYAKQMADSGLAEFYYPENDIPYESVEDFMQTLRSSCHPFGAFDWPGDNMHYLHYCSVALHTLSPGHFFSIKNNAPIPLNLRAEVWDTKKSGGGRAAEATVETWSDSKKQGYQSWYNDPSWDWSKEGRLPSTHTYTTLGESRTTEPQVSAWVQDDYHGFPAKMAPSVLSKGFLPGFGAGSEHLSHHFGCPVPGVYVARSLQMAKCYPMTETTDEVTVPGQKKKSKIAGGSLIALDGTCPIRCVARCLVNPDRKLWKKADSSQYQYMPGDLHITHLYFYAIDPEYSHTVHCQTLPRVLQEGREVERLISQDSFKPICHVLAQSVMETSDNADNLPARIVGTRKAPFG